LVPSTVIRRQRINDVTQYYILEGPKTNAIAIILILIF